MSKFEPPVFSKNWKRWRHFSGLGSERVSLKYSPGSYRSKSVTKQSVYNVAQWEGGYWICTKNNILKALFERRCSRDGFRYGSLVCDHLGILGLVFILDWWWPTRLGTEIN